MESSDKKEVGNMTNFSGCDSCRYYVFNEDADGYECLVNLDEDETARFLSGMSDGCPYYSRDDEYAVVRKQN